MKKILIVEDDDFLVLAYQAKLKKSGFEVEIARDGEEAITLMNKNTPDIILLDLILPKKDGFSTLSEIKSNTKWKDIPVIVASNLGQHEDIDRSLGLGASDYIVKSETSLGEIVAKLNKLLLA